MTNRDYELFEEEYSKETPQKFKHTKKKKTWEQLQNEKERQIQTNALTKTIEFFKSRL